ncbi:MAG TPA: DHA2 family efflux MFS transporter permease subunit, partial [Chloroflexota bacterium]|nr:DHA2 family efflux MFS transporter permease subunit [Chloroflexota bacterium]
MSAALPLAPPRAVPAAPPYRYLVAAAFVLALFVDVLDTTIVNVALPAMGRELGVGNDALEWVVIGYLLSQAVWIPASGWLGDRFGTKRIFVGALGLFVGASALCGLAWSVESLVLFRVVQGIGGGMLTPVGMAMTYRAFPTAERARASAIMGVPVVIAPVLGPVLGGWLVDHVGWRWIFLVNLPLGVVGLLFSLAVLREQVEELPGRFDARGFLLAAVGLLLALFALARAPLDGWGSPPVGVAGAAGVACLAALVMTELRQREPMLDLRLFRNGLFRGVTATTVLTTAGLTGMLFLLQLYLQQARGLSAQEAGLTSFPQALGLVSAIPAAGLLYRRVGARRLVLAGVTGATATAALFLLVDLSTGLW